MINNKFFQEIVQLYKENASKEILLKKLGKGRAKSGMFEGDLINGELEIGQASSQIIEVNSAAQIIRQVMEEFNEVKKQISIENKFSF